MNPKQCARCNTALSAKRATWLCNLVDKLMEFLPEPTATEFGDQLVFGPVPYECLDFSTDIERVVLCDACTLEAVSSALTS